MHSVISSSNSATFICAGLVLQKRRGKMDNWGIIFNITVQNICCDPSLEPSHQDGSNEGSQHVSLRN